MTLIHDLQSVRQRISSSFKFITTSSTFNANDVESLQWGRTESQVIRPKIQGSGIMVSDFINENNS